jgi:hypothetical protein
VTPAPNHHRKRTALTVLVTPPRMHKDERKQDATHAQGRIA